MLHHSMMHSTFRAAFSPTLTGGGVPGRNIHKTLPTMGDLTRTAKDLAGPTRLGGTGVDCGSGGAGFPPALRRHAAQARYLSRGERRMRTVFPRCTQGYARFSHQLYQLTVSSVSLQSIKQE
jgi:hypothetical protein